MRLGQGSVYPALRGLEREGLVRGWKGGPPAAGGRPRSYYELTARGMAATAALREALKGFLLGPDPTVPSRRDLRAMRDRLRRRARLSAFAIHLRRRMAVATQSRR